MNETTQTDVAKQTIASPVQPIVTAPTHGELVELAVKWLRNGARVPCSWNDKDRRVKCSVVLAEIVSSSPETPDAIGFYCSGNQSVLIECKVSRSDFQKDKKKLFRAHPDRGVGDYRFYLAPPGIINVDELPNCWGLLEVGSRGLHVLKMPEQQDKRVRSEINMLWSAVRRMKTGNEQYCKPIR